MAINQYIYAPTQSRWGISEESAFGTAIADGGNYEMCEGPIPTINWGLQRDLSVKFDGSRVLKSSNQYSTTTGQIRTLAFSDVIMRRTDLCNYMVAVMQNVTEAVSTPFAKTFSWAVTTTQPTFVTTNGKYYTIGIVGPIASYMQKFTSCILKTLTLKPGMQGRLAGSGEWISGFAPATTANFTAANFVFGTQNYYDCNSLSLKQIAAADLVVYDWSVTFDNGAVPMSWNSTGGCESYALACNDQGYKVTGNIVIKYDAVSQAYIADMLAGTGRKLQLSIGAAGVAGYFDITLNSCIFGDGTDKDYGRAEGQAISIPFTAVYDGSNAVATITVTDGVDQTWVDF